MFCFVVLKREKIRPCFFCCLFFVFPPGGAATQSTKLLAPPPNRGLRVESSPAHVLSGPPPKFGVFVFVPAFFLPPPSAPKMTKNPAHQPAPIFGNPTVVFTNFPRSRKAFGGPVFCFFPRPLGFFGFPPPTASPKIPLRKNRHNNNFGI